MALRISSGLRNLILQNGSMKRALQNGKLHIYSGTQPTTADAAPTGTLLCTITASSGAHTAEVLATGSVTLTGGTSGNVTSLTVDSVELLEASVAYNTSLAQTASDLADAINKSLTTPEYTASASGAVVTITASRGTGTGANGFVVASTVDGTLTKTDANMSSGVAAVNGLHFQTAAGGVIAKDGSQTWSGAAGATGTAGWFRFVGSVADSGAADSNEAEIRMDGSISTAGAQLNLSSVSITSGATQTVSSFSVTMPAA